MMGLHRATVLRGLKAWGYEIDTDKHNNEIFIRLPGAVDLFNVGHELNWSFAGEVLRIVDSKGRFHPFPKASEFGSSEAACDYYHQVLQG